MLLPHFVSFWELLKITIFEALRPLHDRAKIYTENKPLRKYSPRGKSPGSV